MAAPVGRPSQQLGRARRERLGEGGDEGDDTSHGAGIRRERHTGTVRPPLRLRGCRFPYDDVPAAPAVVVAQGPGVRSSYGEESRGGTAGKQLNFRRAQRCWLRGLPPSPDPVSGPRPGVGPVRHDRDVTTTTARNLMLLDTSSLYFRAYFGVPESVRAPDGTPVNAVRGLLDFISRLVVDHHPHSLVACMDFDWRPAVARRAHPVVQGAPRRRGDPRRPGHRGDAGHPRPAGAGDRRGARRHRHRPRRRGRVRGGRHHRHAHGPCLRARRHRHRGPRSVPAGR